MFPSATASAAFDAESTPNLKPPVVSPPNLNPTCAAEDCAPAGAAPNMKPPCEAAGAGAPAPNRNLVVAAGAGGAEADGAAPGLGDSHEEHLDPASGLFKDLQTSHRHSPGLGLNMSARDGKPELTPLTPAGADTAALEPEAFEGTAEVFWKPSSSSSSLLPDGSSETSVFLAGH